MERLEEGERQRGRGLIVREQRCLRCGHPVPERPRGCKGGHCENCGHPYPLGDCSD